MKVLIVCSANSGKIASFIQEQVNALNVLGIETDYFLIHQKGLSGYLKARKGLLLKIKDFNPQIVHAHYGLSGLLANLQRKVPVITTYHGADINELHLRRMSIFSILLSDYNIFVSKQMVEKVKFYLKRYSVIPCGVDYKVFFSIPKRDARLKLGINLYKRIILFSSTFDRLDKNVPLAMDAVKAIPNAELVELKGSSREEISLLINACDAGLLTSYLEGSPMFIKELLACNKPIVSTNVGDVAECITGIDGCTIVSFNAEIVSLALQYSLLFDSIAVPAEILERNDNRRIAKELVSVYNSVLNS